MKSTGTGTGPHRRQPLPCTGFPCQHPSTHQHVVALGRLHSLKVLVQHLGAREDEDAQLLLGQPGREQRRRWGGVR